MQKIQKPATAINIAFSLVIALGALAFIGTYEVSHASTLQFYCERQYNISFYGELSPMTKKRCNLIFEKITYDWTTGFYNHK